MTTHADSIALMERHTQRLDLLADAHRALSALRKASVQSSPSAGWWARRQALHDVAEASLTLALEQRATARDWNERLVLERKLLATDQNRARHTQAPDALRRALDTANDVLVDLIATSDALQAMAADSIRELSTALSDDRDASRRQLRDVVQSVSDRIARVVRLEDERGELVLQTVTSLARAFPALPSGDVRAERELIELLSTEDS